MYKKNIFLDQWKNGEMDWEEAEQNPKESKGDFQEGHWQDSKMAWNEVEVRIKYDFNFGSNWQIKML